MIPRFNSTLPNHASDGNICHSKRKHTRLPIVVAAACAAGALTATAVADGITPWIHASSAVTTSAHVAPLVSSGQAGTTGGAQLAARIIPRPGHSAPASASAPARVLSPASDWARAFAAASAPHALAANAPAEPPRPAPGHATPVKAAPVKGAPVRAAPARKASPAPAAPARPYTIYDSVTPTAIPAHQQIATYSNGMYKAAATAVRGRGRVLWIDTNGSDPGANVLDVEPGDATPAGAAKWVKTRLNAYKTQLAVVYTMLSEWPSVKSKVGALPSWMQGEVRYWIADPTGVNHVVRGSSATQWYWGQYYDITTANPDFETP